MSVQRKIMMTLLGTAALAMTATGTFAASIDRRGPCEVVETGTRYYFSSDAPLARAGMHPSVTVKCVGLTDSNKYLFYPGLTPESMLAIALAAKVERDSVMLYTYTHPTTLQTLVAGIEIIETIK